MAAEATYSDTDRCPRPAATPAGERPPRQSAPAIHHGNAMIDTPQIASTDIQHTAYIHYVIPRAEMAKVMRPGMAELMAEVAAQGVAPTGPGFSHHLKIEPDIWDFEISVPVAKPIVAAGRVQPGILRAMRVARTVYHGPYEGLSAGWDALMRWVEENGLRAAPNLWESYLTGPESGSDCSLWRTELNRPLLE